MTAQGPRTVEASIITVHTETVPTLQLIFQAVTRLLTGLRAVRRNVQILGLASNNATFNPSDQGGQLLRRRRIARWVSAS